jgi:spermidine synthase
VAASYEELDHRKTAIGELILRRRRVPLMTPEPIYEIMLGNDLLMSSLLNESEMALAHLGIAAVGDGIFDVLVGGLGLGYTAWAALGYERVRSVTVIELLPEVIEWHEQGRVPLGDELSGSERCRFLEGDFFVLAADPSVRDLVHPERGYGAILVDIDHAPDSWLDASSRSFYREGPIARMTEMLQPGGVFALWSAGAADARFAALLEPIFQSVTTHEIEVFNPMIDEDMTDTIYVAKKAGVIPVDPPAARPPPPARRR